ncbi:MAG: hypothetical protein MJ236_03625 [Clostridia bacterium]|nr:hypothetical protein [Clostridia bacterium]
MKKDASGIKSLLSVISILVAFLFVCFAVITVLISTGVMNIDWILGKRTNGNDTPPGNPPTTLITDEDLVNLDEAKIRQVLSEIPFYETFYARVVSNYVGNFNSSGDETYLRYDMYDVFKWKNKYKIVKYNRFQEVISTEICDGIHIMVEDSVADDVNYFSKGEQDTFMLHSPIPDFSIFKTEEYKIISYKIEDDVLIVVCQMDNMKLEDTISINMKDGMILGFDTVSDFGNGSYSYSYSVGNYTIGSNNGQKYTDSDFQIR